MANIKKNQVGVIPYFIDKKDKKKRFVIITPKDNTDYWIFPKGNIKKELGEKKSAAEEAYEEAGLKGKVFSIPNLYYEYEKFGKKYRVKFFLMQVSKVLDKWDEDDIRERRIVKFKKAESLISDKSLKNAFKKAVKIQMLN